MFSSFLLMKSSTAANNYNVVSFGAKPDGRTDSTKAFLGAWPAACRSAAAVTVTVPRGSFLLKPVEFRQDRTLDARGASFWSCRKSGKSCPVGARSMTFNWANDVVVTGLTSINSQATHLVINSCNNVIVRKVKLVAPDQSPNTDGLHVQGSAGVTVTDSTFQTKDDCISIGPGTRNLYMSKLNCGPGHGIRIRSLSIRITVRLIKDSGVKISQVVYRNIQGTWRTQQALTFDCSRSNPCQAIRLHDIKLTFNGRSATSTCLDDITPSWTQSIICVL
ncbi:Glycoside hydrolase family 28 [Arabidopsis thaliana x Arabidopsis arenosa]|uniref:Glycoside hydrolase family 28 n=1 Tax=Arabidopsis thaliana x Arabidopsis arenosa TaxID=1240361 RepID=A0A8T2B0F6_9BRAS|nr:Glycoside hydrolase family 28 [Arabidopsis thaliana x Arabidopsis arenosa]